jgi:hypothetical protein
MDLFLVAPNQANLSCRNLLEKSLVVLEDVEVEGLFGCFFPICQVAS